jgi:hypothetical protein
MNDLLDFVLDAHGGLNRWSDGSLPSEGCLPAAGPLEPVRTVH